MELIVVGVGVLIAIGLVVYSMWPKGDDADILSRRVLGQSQDEASRSITRTKSSTALLPRFLERAAPALSKPVMPKDDGEQSRLRTKLANAGFRQEQAATMFLASKTIAAVFFVVVMLLFTWHNSKPFMSMLGYVAFGGGLGIMLPEMWLYVSRKQRMEQVRDGLPDALDLMVVSVEAGLGLDAALMRVGDEMRFVHPCLAEELQIVTIETQLGIQRGEALEKMANRTGVEQMRSLVAVIVQAEKLGTSVAKALRTQADALRTKRRQRAEERAQKTAVKLMLPLVLFIFPAILIVLGVPAGIKLAATLSGGGPLSGS